MAEERNQRSINSWGELFLRAAELGLGAATLTVDTAQKVVNDLVRRGQVSKEESENLVDRLMVMGREQRTQLTEMIDKGVERTMERMDLARRSDLDALRARVADLEATMLGHTHVEYGVMPKSLNDNPDNE